MELGNPCIIYSQIHRIIFKSGSVAILYIPQLSSVPWGLNIRNHIFKEIKLYVFYCYIIRDVHGFILITSAKSKRKDQSKKFADPDVI